MPRDYLVWLLENSTRLDSDLRVDIERVIHNEKSAPRILQSARDSALVSELHSQLKRLTRPTRAKDQSPYKRTR